MVVGTLATRTAPDVSSNSTRSVKVPPTSTPTRSEAMDRSCTAGGRVKSIALVATAGGAEGDAAQDERDRHDDGHRQRLAKPERRRGDADHGRHEQGERWRWPSAAPSSRGATTSRGSPCSDALAVRGAGPLRDFTTW